MGKHTKGASMDLKDVIEELASTDDRVDWLDREFKKLVKRVHELEGRLCGNRPAFDDLSPGEQMEIMSHEASRSFNG